MPAAARRPPRCTGGTSIRWATSIRMRRPSGLGSPSSGGCRPSGAAGRTYTDARSAFSGRRALFRHGGTAGGVFTGKGAPPDGTVAVNARCLVRTQDGHRVVLVAGIVLCQYSVGGRMAEAHAMVSLVEQGWAEQRDVPTAFGYASRTVRRFQRRFEAGGLPSLLPRRSQVSAVRDGDRPNFGAALFGTGSEPLSGTASAPAAR